MFEQTLLNSFNLPEFDSKLLTVPMAPKDFVHQYHHKNEIFDLHKGHTI